MTHEYKITGMTCGSCVARVKKELLKLGDILSANVQLESPQAVITMSKHVPSFILQQAVNKAGNYTISENGNEMAIGPDSSVEKIDEEKSYLPIFLIFGYIAGVTIVVQYTQGYFNWMQWMGHFMAGFFLVFSFFKLMSLKGFAEGYRTYDIVAKKLPVWGFVYPFIELLLGISFLTGFDPLGTNIVTLVVMAISSVGVIQSLLKKIPFQCACLGTVIRLPLSRVTLFEDLVMVLMSAIMLIATI